MEVTARSDWKVLLEGVLAYHSSTQGQVHVECLTLSWVLLLAWLMLLYLLVCNLTNLSWKPISSSLSASSSTSTSCV